MSIWQSVPENEIAGLQARADEHGGELSVDDALSVDRPGAIEARLARPESRLGMEAHSS